MRNIDTATLAALNGSRSGDTLVCYAWYDGNLVSADPLPVAGWALDWDATRQTQTLDLDLMDDDGKLAPWLFEDPLGVGGTQIQVLYEVGGAGVVNMGWYRVTSDDPDEQWLPYIVDDAGYIQQDSPYPNGKRLVLVSGGATIKLRCDDLGILVKNYRFLAPESPVGASPTILGELQRILGDLVPVATTAGVTDRAVSKKLIYKDDRLNAAQDLCQRIGCDYRMNGDGQFEVYPLTTQTPVWTVKGGREGVLVKVNRSQKLEGLYNIFVVQGTKSVTRNNGQTVQVPIVSIARITSGPLRWDGPHGPYPTFYESTMITTQDEADAYAQTMMLTQLAGLTVELVVECLPHPGLQQGDWVTVVAPVVNSQTAALNGRVTSMSLKSYQGTAVDRMTLTVQCTYSDVALIFGGIDRG